MTLLARTRRALIFPIDGVKLTDYYDAYSAYKYKIFLNKLRAYIVTEFNEQVLKRVGSKNNIDTPPRLQLDEGAFIQDSLIRDYFDKFKKGEMGKEAFVNLIF
jgi:hypothetical protein